MRAPAAAPIRSYDLKGLREQLEAGGYRCTDFPEVLYSRYVRRTGVASGDIFTFEFGTGGHHVCLAWLCGGAGLLGREVRGPLHAGPV